MLFGVSGLSVLENMFLLKKKKKGGWLTLARWFSWLECCPVHQKVAGSISGPGTHLGCGFDPLSGCVQEATDSLSLSLINKHILEAGLTKS